VSHVPSEAFNTAGVALEVGLEELVSTGAVRVPPYPACALRLQGVLATDNYTTDDLVAAMKGDPVFTANLLRLSNSPFYRRGGEVTSLPVAVQRVGARELVRLAMAASVASLASASGPLHPLRRQVWRQALSSALVCEALAGVEGSDPAEAFVAGLLHDAGKLLVVGALEELGQRQSLGVRAEGEWWALLEQHHVRCGELLAQRWRLPGALGAVIATHHHPHQELGPLPRLAHLADQVVALLEAGPGVDEAALRRAGLPRAAVAAVLVRLPGIPATLAAFEVGGPGPLDASALAARPRSAGVRAPEGLCLEVTGEAAGRWAATHLGPASLEVLAPRLLVPNLLLEGTLQPHGLHFFALVQRCQVEGDGYLTELRPFALAPEEASRWAELTALDAPPAPPAPDPPARRGTPPG
jgi:HD-like signal output (HDOD) protein